VASAKRRILYFAPLRHTFSDFCASVQRQPWIKGHLGANGCSWHGRNLAFAVDSVGDPAAAADQVRHHYYNLLVLDCRNLPHPDADPDLQVRGAEELLTLLRSERDVERRYPQRRVVVLVGDADADRIDRLTFRMGQHHVAACLRDRSLASWATTEVRDELRDRLVDQFWSLCQELLVKRRKGSKAICSAGGGISGLYYELGVLKCLQDVLSSDIRSFDMYFGVSAGAVVSSWLANGISVDEVIARLGELDRGWRYRLQLSVRHLNVKEVPRRIVLANQELFRYLLRMVQRRDELSLASIVGVWAVLLGPIFDSSEFEEMLAQMFSEEGRSNDFRKLRGRLYVGATDQDRREHVLFGDEGFDDVPISKAIQASIAWHPFFPSVEIRGRYYTDGVVTRTVNLTAAIEKGADLVFVLDPFVPLITDEPGANARKGNMWILEQDLKTMSYTRFEQAREELQRRQSHASVYTFVPSNRMRRLMASQNPLVARNFDAIVCEAYRSTRRRLSQLEYRMRGDLLAHGIKLDLAPAMEKVERMRAARQPSVALLVDELPGGRRGHRVA